MENGKKESENPGSSHVEDFDSVDKDLCSAKKIKQHFPNRYIQVSSVKATEEEILCSPLFSDNYKTRIASVLSDRSVVVIDRESFKILGSFSPHKKEITDIRFSPLNENVIYSSSLNGTIKMWDMRSNSIEKKMNANTEDSNKPLTTFDVSPTERLICAGTELVGEDSFVLFWDLRGDKLLGGYWDSHSDDISKVRFNSNDSKTLISSGSDGLLNVFDVSQSKEDEALTYCLNTEAVVHTFSMRNEKTKTHILAYTDIHSVQLWDIEEAAPTHSFSREKITKSLKRNVSYECYPIPMHHNNGFDKNPILLAGSGLEHESSCLRLLKINEKSGNLEPHGLLVGNEENEASLFTQVASFCPQADELITVREDGIISMWKRNDSSNTQTFKETKSKGKIKQKPY